MVVVTVLMGCGNPSARQSLTGKVTLDGRPLSEGSIRFVPAAGTLGPSAGGAIKDGTFSIDAEKGTLCGSFRVEITATRKTGKKIKEPMSGEIMEVQTQFLPARYNSDSQLTAEVKSNEANQFDFALESR